MTIIDDRTRDISPIAIRYSIRKRVCGHYSNSAAIHLTTSDTGEAKKVFEIGNVGLYPFPKKNDHGRFNNKPRVGHVTSVSFKLYGQDWRPVRH